MVPPLPYRPLDVRGNGVYDPVRKTFYPFRYYGSGTGGEALPAKPNIMYYVHTVTVVGSNTGDHAAANVSFTSTVGGSIVYLGYVSVPSSVANSNGVGMFGQFNPCILTDANKLVSYTMSASVGYGVLVYAEIPVDEGEV